MDLNPELSLLFYLEFIAGLITSQSEQAFMAACSGLIKLNLAQLSLLYQTLLFKVDLVQNLVSY